MIFVANARINEAQDADAPAETNVLNDALSAGGSLSMGAVANTKMNEPQDTADSDAPVEPNFLKDVLDDRGGLSMVVVGNTKTYEARAYANSSAAAAEATIDAPDAADT